MVRCGDDSLYVGIATDVARRFDEHRSEGKKCAKFLRGRGPLELVFVVGAGTRAEALRLEAAIKRASKKDKELLVQGSKPVADWLRT